MGQLIAMADDPDAKVRIAVFHAPASDRPVTCLDQPQQITSAAGRR
jgi:hypothetical protein